MLSLVKKLSIIPYGSLMISDSDGFLIPDNPLRKIVWGRAVLSTVSEKLQLDVFDTSAIIHQITCNCDHRWVGLYVAGFSYFIWRNNVINENVSEDKLQKNEYYLMYKRMIRRVLFVLFFVFTKDIDNAI